MKYHKSPEQTLSLIFPSAGKKSLSTSRSRKKVFYPPVSESAVVKVKVSPPKRGRRPHFVFFGDIRICRVRHPFPPPFLQATFTPLFICFCTVRSTSCFFCELSDGLFRWAAGGPVHGTSFSRCPLFHPLPRLNSWISLSGLRF